MQYPLQSKRFKYKRDRILKIRQGIPPRYNIQTYMHNIVRLILLVNFIKMHALL